MYWDVSRIPASQEPAQPTPCFSSVPTTLGLPDTLLQNRLLQGLSEKRLNPKPAHKLCPKNLRFHFPPPHQPLSHLS